ncbi:MAG TPA: ABC transporter ATP-binding protein [Oculatellaceae cyanobacterium]
MTLKAVNLSVGAGDKSILSGINLEAKPGKALVILGPNGSGKSTLVRTLARQLRPISGEVMLDEQPIWQLSPTRFAQHVAFVQQNLEPGIGLSIREYVSLGRSPHQKWWQWQESDGDRECVNTALAATELSDISNRSVAQLSGGERQRAAIAIALAQKPSILLLDEPTAHLDFKHQSELLKLLNQLKRQLALIVVLHDLTAASYLADEVLLLRKNIEGPSGQQQENSSAILGSAEDILDTETLQSAFGVVFKTTEEFNTRYYFVKLDERQIR